jgi:DNA processing protein
MSEDVIYHMSENERIDRIRLIRTPRIGAVTYHRLMHRFGSATAALAALPDIARRAGGDAPRIHSADAARRERDQAERLDASLVFHGEPGYPALLAQTDDAPAFLTVRGNKGLLAGHPIAVVGARNASANGQYLAETLARDLGNAGMIIVSGLARGIDAAAHRGALATGTVAVIGGGIDIAYPRENRHLQDAIAETGLLVTEARPGEQPTARHFPRRNRIIAGMSAGVIVVEAAPRSGSLITARLVGEYGRDVFAVPGAAHDHRGRGTNQLLREGAILTETADDVLSALPHAFEPPRPITVAPVTRPPVQTALPATDSLKDSDGDDPVSTITSALGTVPSRIDDIVRLTGIPSDAVLSAFTELELAGRLERHPGGRVALRAAS